MDIETIRERVRAGNYLAKSHAIQHAFLLLQSIWLQYNKLVTQWEDSKTK
jgi:hypothetical protein